MSDDLAAKAAELLDFNFEIGWIRPTDGDFTRAQTSEIANKIREVYAPQEAELERLRLQLAACSSVALANTRESAAAARQMHPDFYCATVMDVAAAVDREMAAREEVERLQAENQSLQNLTPGNSLPKLQNQKNSTQG